MKNHFRAFLAYALSAAAVLAAALLFGGPFMEVYFPVAFFIVVALDFYRTQVVENGESEVSAYSCSGRGQRGIYQDVYGFLRVDYFGSPRQYPSTTPDPLTLPPCETKRTLGDNFVDRFLFYIFSAPFILPVRLYQAAVASK